MAESVPHHIKVQRTARYYVIGAPNEMVRDVWIVCHGFSQLARDFIVPFAALGDETRLFAAPEALSRFYLDSRPAHTQASKVGATWMTREDREAEIEDTVGYLDALHGHILLELATHGVARDKLRVHALGFSQGAAAVSRWAAQGSAVVDNLVVWASGIPQDVNLRALVERRPDLSLDLVYGVRDQFMTTEAVAAQRAVLDASGVAYAVHTFEGGHVLNSAMLRELAESGDVGRGRAEE